jgi:hypothetical protein
VPGARMNSEAARLSATIKGFRVPTIIVMHSSSGTENGARNPTHAGGYTEIHETDVHRCLNTISTIHRKGKYACNLIYFEHSKNIRLSYCIRTRSLYNRRLGSGLECVCQATLAAILTILVECHLSQSINSTRKGIRGKVAYEYSSTALCCRALPTETFDLPIGVDLVVLQNGHLDLLALVLDLLGGLKCSSDKQKKLRYHEDPRYTNVVGLFLSLLGTTTKTEDQVKCGFLLDVVVAEGTTILELLASEDQALLVGGDTKYLISREQGQTLQ